MPSGVYPRNRNGNSAQPNLPLEIKVLTDENSSLHRRVDELEAENKQLQAELLTLYRRLAQFEPVAKA